MALNKYMHPRNMYRTPPDFTQLAIQFPEFSAVSTIDIAGSVKIDFKDPTTLRTLSRVLLLRDFNLDIEMPLDRLVPAIPLRLNYILWLEDVIHELSLKDNDIVYGIDVGCGASCIYPLIASKRNKWKMLASEADRTSFECAKRNVEKNGLHEFVTVHQTEQNTILSNLPLESNHAYHFTMCNPPFYSSERDLSHTSKDRTDHRAPPKAARTGANQELVVSGGEVSFVNKMIDESKILKNKISVFTTMLGHKSSLSPVKKHLEKLGIKNITETRFCQGRTMRWALAWSFQTCPLNKVVDHSQILKKSTHSLTFTVPRSELGYSIENIATRFQAILEKLQIQYRILEQHEFSKTYQVIAEKNTWSHQRRLRRQAKREDALKSQTQPENRINLENPKPDSRPQEIESTNNNNTDFKNQTVNQTLMEKDEPETLKKIKLDPLLTMAVCIEQEFVQNEQNIEEDSEISDDVCGDILLKLCYLEGKGGKDAVHQIMQYAINNWDKQE